MKRLRKNIRLLGFFLCGLFVLLAVYGAYSVAASGGRWFASSANTYARKKRQDVIAGDILDRNGVVLATTAADGARAYASETDVRRAVAHVLGNQAGDVGNGVETFMASYLYGFNMGFGERLGYVFRGEQRVGDTVSLTIDSRLARQIAALFPAGKAGAVAVMNYRTGEVLALESFPNFDPMNITAQVRNDPLTPFLNRATQSLKAPGSTFKIVTAAAALEHFPDALTRSYLCDGQLAVGDRIITDAGTDLAAGKITQHGQLTLRRAFQVSCNNTFARLALDLTDPVLRRTAENMGFNDNFLFRDLVVENSSYPTQNRTDREIAWTGAGQSALAATPLHMCMIAGAVANDGVMMEPALLLQAVGNTGKTRAAFRPRVYRRAMEPETAQTLQEFMRSVVTSGTGTQAALAGANVCGKTGSAEIDTQENTNAWFVGFLDDPAAPYALAVVVEDAGAGGSVAAPLARQIFDWLLKFAPVETLDA